MLFLFILDFVSLTSLLTSSYPPPSLVLAFYRPGGADGVQSETPRSEKGGAGHGDGADDRLTKPVHIRLLYTIKYVGFQNFLDLGGTDAEDLQRIDCWRAGGKGFE